MLYYDLLWFTYDSHIDLLGFTYRFTDMWRRISLDLAVQAESFSQLSLASPPWSEVQWPPSNANCHGHPPAQALKLNM